MQRHLGLPCVPVLLEDLEQDFETYRSRVAAADLVVTTVVHRPEVQAVLLSHLEQPVKVVENLVSHRELKR